jgi:rhodanese-related sulfurtransferase
VVSIATWFQTNFRPAYATLGAAQAQALLSDGATLLDVREPNEWSAGHAPRARHIPLGQLAARQGELSRTRPVVVVCRSGNRSKRAAASLAAAGFEVSNLAGGMRAWSAAGLPVVAKGGRAGTVV